MLDRLTSLAHFFRVFIETSLHRLDHMLMLPSRDAALRTGRTLRLERALRTCAGPVVPQILAVLLTRIPIDQPLIGRTAVDILLTQIDEVLLAEAALRLCTRTQGLWQCYYDVGSLACQDLVAVEVTAVRNHLELVGVENSLR